MPRGFGDSIEQSAGSNGWLRRQARTRPSVAGRSWARKLQHSIRREVEIPTGVHFESSDERPPKDGLSAHQPSTRRHPARTLLRRLARQHSDDFRLA